MTASSYKKIMKQIENKPVKLNKFIRFNQPRSRKFGIASFPCRNCGRTSGHIKKYGLNLCRQCFRELAPSLGFKKYH